MSERGIQGCPLVPGLRGWQEPLKLNFYRYAWFLTFGHAF